MLFGVYGLVFLPSRAEFFWGLGVGAAVASVAWATDSPPQHIARWQQGAEGEKETAKVLRRLTRDGWTLVHDIDRRWGNIDHVLIGPPGVFLLESKNLGGILRVEQDVLKVRWHEDPEDGYEMASLGRRVRRDAADLSAALRRVGGPRVWVQPVVVLWGSFDQRSLECEGVAWVRGKDLADILEARPVRMSRDQMDATAARLTVAFDAGVTPEATARV